MKIKRMDLKAVPSGHATERSDFDAADHAVYEHLHFDLQSVDQIVLNAMNRFVANSNGMLSWQNFKRVSYHDVMSIMAQSSHNVEKLAEILANPDLFGAPNAHLTAKFTGVSTSEDYAHFLGLYREGVELISSTQSSGYIEGEQISFRAEFAECRYNPQRTPSDCPVRNLTKIPLSQLGRKFRTTEIHISFEDLSLVNPILLEDIFSQGFYTAFRFNEETGIYNVIATIQGFEQEITLILADMFRWLQLEASSGNIGCSAVIKKEDIVRFSVFGQNPKLQKVVAPGSYT